MAPVESNIPKGDFIAPGFNLPDVVSGRNASLTALKSDKATVIIFMCNHCPYVKHVLKGILDLSRDYMPRGVSFIGISSNDVSGYPEDSPEKMASLAREESFPFPYLYDESQEVARAYDAACTPEFHIFDGRLRSVYRGQMDAARPGNKEAVTGIDLRKALDSILSGREVSKLQYPAAGCSIKWKKS